MTMSSVPESGRPSFKTAFKTVVFLGPTMPVEDARALLPDAVFLPPAGQADVLSALTIHQPQIVALIDGVFGQSLAVWHKELLYALHCGVAVFGASSMGALRAVECAEFGMVPFGTVAGWYSDGTVSADDEVALAHAGPEDGYFPLSEPLVNLRASLAAARAAGAIDARLQNRVVDAAKRLFFPERTRERIWAEARLTAEEIGRLEGFLASGAVDVKRQDAEALLRHLAALTELPPPVPFPFVRSYFFEVLYDRDRRVRQAGHEVPLANIAAYAALHRPDFAEINAAALGRLLTVQLADLVGVRVDDRAVAEETQRFCFRNRLADRPALADWCRRNDLTDAEFSELMRDLAVERAMRRWLIDRRFLSRTTKPVLNELRLRGLYEKTAADAALVERTVDLHFGDLSLQPTDSFEQLLMDHLTNTDAQMDAPAESWAYEAGFKDALDMRIDLVKARQVRGLFAALATEAEQALSALEGFDPAPGMQAGGKDR